MTKWHCTGEGPELGGRGPSRCAGTDGISSACPPRAGSASGWPTHGCGTLARKADRCSRPVAPAPAGGPASPGAGWGLGERRFFRACQHLCRGPLAASLPAVRSPKPPGWCLGRGAARLRARSRWRARRTPRRQRPASLLAPPSNGACLAWAAAAQAGGSWTARCLWGRPLAPWRQLGAWEMHGTSLLLEAANMT